jgi:predicted O-methyltransferase YrrM
MPAVAIPSDLERVISEAWEKTQRVPGFLLENEAKFLGVLAACTPAPGLIVEIGSFKGRSTVMLASVAAHYGRGPVVAIDPHNFNLSVTAATPHASSYGDFMESLRAAGVSEHVEFHHALSKEVSASWNRPIRLLWIDGDHSYAGTKGDFDGFIPHLSPNGIVAMHDSLNLFPGPIRVFVEEVLRSSKFGAARFVHSIAWAQFRPKDGHKFEDQRSRLSRSAARLLPFAEEGPSLSGFRKLAYKWKRSRIPRAPLSPEQWATLLKLDDDIG